MLPLKQHDVVRLFTDVAGTTQHPGVNFPGNTSIKRKVTG